MPSFSWMLPTQTAFSKLSFGDMKTLRRKIGRGVFQPGEDLEPYGIGKGFKKFYLIHGFMISIIFDLSIHF